MKKPSIEGKQDFCPVPPGFSKGNLRSLNFLLIFLLINENLFPQIPINGFCKYNYFKVDSGFTNIVMLNFNNDAYSDFVLFNPDKKEIAAVTGSLKGEIIGIKKFPFPFEISSFLPLTNQSQTQYAFTSRKNKKAGLLELNNIGKPNLIKSVEFNSYPELINTSDINADGKNEILISGGAFNNISIYNYENEFVESKIIKGNFSSTVFIDLSNDGYPDIAAYDLVKRDITFFYNNSQGDFHKVRSIPLSEKPSTIKTFDLNLDSYEDIIFSSGNYINIWYGDFRSSFENKKNIKTNYKPDKFIYGDFNKDGLIDLVYLNINHSLISVLFAKNEFDYYQEIIYLQQKDLRDIIPYYSRFIEGFIALSLNGEIHTITNLSSFTEDVNISIGAKPNAITFFDNENNGITDFCFIDKLDKKIKFIVRDITGIPVLYFSQQLFEEHENIIALNLKSGEKNYICFSYNQKIIEIVKADFINKQFKKTMLYSPAEILDLKVSSLNENEYKIFILYQTNEELNLGIFTYKDFKFNFINQVVDNIKVLDASIGLKPFSINYWAERKERIFLLKKEPGKISEMPVEKFSFLKDSIYRIISFTEDLLNREKDITISFINDYKKSYAVVSADTFSVMLGKKRKTDDFRITSKNNLFFGEIRFNGLKRLSVYMPEKKSVNKFEFIKKGKQVYSTKLIDTLEIGNFFIKNMTSKNYHLVYSNFERNCITIKRLKG